MSSETNLESEIMHVLLIFSKTESFLFSDVSMRFYGISDSCRKCEGASKVSKSAVCYDHHTLECHFVLLLLQFFLSSYDVEQIF